MKTDFFIAEVRLYLIILELAGKNEKIIEVVNGELGGMYVLLLNFVQ